MPDGRSTAVPAILRRRARMSADIRAFFAARGVLEVDTPALSPAGNPDPAIESLCCHVHAPGDSPPLRCFLHTSPEFAMKRLLAAGSGDIYQLCTVFRDRELGRLHRPEFRLLEWYRLGFDLHRLMDEVGELVRELLARALPELRLSYRDAFQRALGADPLSLDEQALARLAAERGLELVGQDLDRDGWLDLLMSHCVEPAFPDDTLVFVHDWPASQAALARLSPAGLAQRFELYLNGIELANGFHELTDAAEQRRRFEAENRRRIARGMAPMPLDEDFLAALESGLPDCSGVALGYERLLMIATGSGHIDAVVSC